MGNRLRAAALILAVGGVVLLLYGQWIPFKACLAQHLLKRAWLESRATGNPVKAWPWADSHPVARLVQERLGVSMIVLAGTSGETLAFGPGLDSAGGRPGEPGHVLLYGHRDTSFAFLRELEPGDLIRLEAADATRRFQVAALAVYDAGEIYFNREADGLSLITCYPFAGTLPHTRQRFVVSARELANAG